MSCMGFCKKTVWKWNVSYFLKKILSCQFNDTSEGSMKKKNQENEPIGTFA